MPRSRSEWARAFSDLIQANYRPSDIQVLADRARSIERSTLLMDVIATHDRARFVAEQSDIRPEDWGDVRWQG